MVDVVEAVAQKIEEQHPRVTVLGAAMLDRWVTGRVERLSREAPVPVVEVHATKECAGGAGNTAANLSALGGRVRMLTMVGGDDEGRRLRHLLEESGVDVTAVVVRDGTDTPCKTRIVGNEQILVRADVPSALRLTAAEQDEWAAVVAAMEADETLMVCDYASEMFPVAFIERLGALARSCRTIVDSHDLSRWAALEPDIVTPNAAEAERLIGMPLDGADRGAVTDAHRADILTAAHAHRAVVTLDRDGAVTLDGEEPAHATLARAVPESQTAGAGDTYAAALALATAVGCDLADAADIAQAAADVAVQRVGTSVCTLADLRGARPHEDAVVADRTALRAVLDAERRAGRTVVFTNGCFDILHPGHTAYLAQAKALGDILVVAVNDDDSVRRLKGPERPVNTVDDRARVLAALHCVDYVIPFPESSPIALLSLLRPQLYVKGGDYTPEMLDETSVVLAYGGQVKTLGYFPTYSTTSVVERITHGRDPAA